MVKTVADQFAETLAAAGVKRIYGVVCDSLNGLTDSIRRQGKIEWVHVRHEEVAAFAAGGEAHVTGELAVCAGSCGPGSLHFVNGLFECHRNRSPVILIASQVLRSELGFDYIQEVDFKDVYRGCSVYCDMIYTPEQALRKTVLACQTAIARKGPAVLVIPVDIAMAEMHDETPYRVQVSQPVVRPSEAEEKTVSMRRLGVQQQQVLSLAEAVALLGTEATPPDLVIPAAAA